MTAPTFALATSGTDPKVTTKGDLDDEMNRVIALLYAQINPEAVAASVAEAVSVAGEVSLGNYGGTADAITADTSEDAGDVTVAPSFKITFRAPATNTTTAPTLAVNGGTAYPIRENGNTALEVGSLPTDRSITLRLTGSGPSLRWEGTTNPNTIAEFNAKMRQPYASRAAAIAATPATGQNSVSYMQNGRRYDFFKDASGTAMTMADGSKWSPAWTATLGHFGFNAVPGTTNMSDAVRALHTFANARKLSVNYDGVGALLIDADAQIVLNTNTNWFGAIIKAAGGIDPTPTDGEVRRMLIVEDAGTPLVEATTAVTLDNMKIGSRTATADFFTGVGYAFMLGLNGKTVPVRDKTEGEFYYFGMTMWCSRDGITDFPLPIDWTSTTSVSSKYRAMPEGGHVKIEGLVADADTFNNQSLITIRRNNTSVDNTTVVPGSSPPSDTVNRLIEIQDAGQITIDGLVATAQDDGGDGVGTYAIRWDRAANVTCTRISAQNGWGATAGSYINGLWFSNSTVNRIDAHRSLGNAFISEILFSQYGVRYGSAFGKVSVDKSVCVECPAIATREDYGGFCDGDLSVTRTQFISNEFDMIPWIDLASNPVGAPGFTLSAARTITCKDNTRPGLDDNNGGSITPVAIEVFYDVGHTVKSAVYAPDVTEVSSVKGHEWRLLLPLDYANMLIRDNGHPIQLIVSDSHPTKVCTSIDDGIYFRPNRIPGAGNSALDVRASNVTQLHVNVTEYNSARVYLNDCEISALRTDENTLVRVDGGKLLPAQLFASETISPVGGTAGTGADIERDLQIVNVTMGNNWDISKATVLQGIRYLDASTNITLPAGATRATAFTGYAAASWS